MTRASCRPRIAIIGSGLSGGILTAELAQTFNVTVFERGPLHAFVPPRFETFGHPLGLTSTVGYGLGGTTNLWRGCLLPMEDEEFGNSWPASISRDMARYRYRVLVHLLGEREAKRWHDLWDCRPRVLTSDVLLRSILVPQTAPRASGFSSWKAADVETGVVVEEVIPSGSGVTVRAQNRGFRAESQFEAAVICAGSLNSPLILRNHSPSRSAIGENLTDHPTGLVAKLRLSRPGYVNTLLSRDDRTRAIFKYRDEETNLWASFQLCPTHDSKMEEDHYLSNENQGGGSRRGTFSKFRDLSNPDYRGMLMSKALGRKRIGQYAYVLAMLEQEAKGLGRVLPGKNNEPIISWRITDSSVGALERGLDRLSTALEAELFLSAHTRNRLWSGAHHAGTCRISSDESDGVVDSQLRMHGQDHIYVCDGSVLPSTGSSHTGLAIGSLAVRLADQLKSQYTNGRVRRSFP